MPTYLATFVEHDLTPGSIVGFFVSGLMAQTESAVAALDAPGWKPLAADA